jgi:hypothetical protein
MPRTQYDLIRLNGGLDQVTPTLSLPSGICRRAANFECSIYGGYRRILGYERFDGRPSPSEQLYSLLEVAFLPGESISAGDVITGSVSTSTAEVIIVNDKGGGIHELVVTKASGQFDVAESLEVSTVPSAVVVEQLGVEPNGALAAGYLGATADLYRADIAAVPGEGRVLGVGHYKDTVYAWRNAAGGASAKMFESTPTGWQEITLPIEMGFYDGAVLITAGMTVEGQSSGATGQVKAVILESGSFGNSDAAGRLIFTSVSGTFTATEHLKVGTTNNKARVLAAQSQITLLPDGKYETVVATFGGEANTKLYGVDGVNRAFEFDGTYFIPVNGPVSPDKPNHLAVHKQHLFLSYGASLIFSGTTLPFNFTSLAGAGEIACPENITNLTVMPGDQTSGALAVFGLSNTSILYGSDDQSFALAVFNSSTGARPGTAKSMEQVYSFDNRGITALTTSLNFGNFVAASPTLNLRPFIVPRINLAVGSMTNTENGQYRVFFSDGTALYMTVVNGRVAGTMPIQMKDAVSCVTQGLNSDGQTVAFFGATNGFVYQIDKGTSFDGEDIIGHIDLVYNATGSPRILKRYRKAVLEVTGDSYCEFGFGYKLGYGTQDLTQSATQGQSTDLRSSFWDEGQWDNVVLDGNEISPNEIDLTGSAENMAISISSISALFKPFTVNSVIVHYTPRRGM